VQKLLFDLLAHGTTAINATRREVDSWWAPALSVLTLTPPASILAASSQDTAHKSWVPEDKAADSLDSASTVIASSLLRRSKADIAPA
jgi:hypothetical protein